METSRTYDNVDWSGGNRSRITRSADGRADGRPGSGAGSLVFRRD
jgi:hypothetical protein